VPIDVQVITCGEPANRVSPPLGDVIVRELELSLYVSMFIAIDVERPCPWIAPNTKFETPKSNPKINNSVLLNTLNFI
jgi:hypothetical protein